MFIVLLLYYCKLKDKNGLFLCFIIARNTLEKWAVLDIFMRTIDPIGKTGDG